MNYGAPKKRRNKSYIGRLSDYGKGHNNKYHKLIQYMGIYIKGAQLGLAVFFLR